MINNNEDAIPGTPSATAGTIKAKRGIPANTVALFGFIIDSGDNNILRLALNINLDEYIDIPSNEIVVVKRDATSVFEGAHVIVPQELEIKVNRVVKAPAEDFLEGDIFARFQKFEDDLQGDHGGSPRLSIPRHTTGCGRG